MKSYYHEKDRDVIIKVKGAIPLTSVYVAQKDSYYVTLHQDYRGDPVPKLIQKATATAFVYTNRGAKLAQTAVVPAKVLYPAEARYFKQVTKRNPLTEADVENLVAYDLTENNSKFYVDKLTIKISL
jgi:hypothetical protein